MLRKAIGGAVLALAATSGVLVAAPAEAAPVGAASDLPRYLNLGPSDFCPNGYFCGFESVGLGDSGVAFLDTETNWGTIPAAYRWINNRARSGINWGLAGALDDVVAYPLPGFRNDPRFPAVCVRNIGSNRDWGALRPESNKWFNNC